MQAIQEFITANPYIAFGILVAIMALGDVVSKVSKGWFPSGLAIMILLVAGFWTILPATLAADAGISTGAFCSGSNRRSSSKCSLCTTIWIRSNFVYPSLYVWNQSGYRSKTGR